MGSRHGFAVISSALAIAWACLLVWAVPQAMCAEIFNPLSAELRRAHPDHESRRLAGRYCDRFGSVIRSSVALAVAPAVVTNGACALMAIAAWRRTRRAGTPPAEARDA